MLRGHADSDRERHCNDRQPVLRLGQRRRDVRQAGGRPSVSRAGRTVPRGERPAHHSRVGREPGSVRTRPGQAGPGQRVMGAGLDVLGSRSARLRVRRLRTVGHGTPCANWRHHAAAGCAVQGPRGSDGGVAQPAEPEGERRGPEVREAVALHSRGAWFPRRDWRTGGLPAGGAGQAGDADQYGRLKRRLHRPCGADDEPSGGRLPGALGRHGRDGEPDGTRRRGDLRRSPGQLERRRPRPPAAHASGVRGRLRLYRDQYPQPLLHRHRRHGQGRVGARQAPRAGAVRRQTGPAAEQRRLQGDRRRRFQRLPVHRRLRRCRGPDQGQPKAEPEPALGAGSGQPEPVQPGRRPAGRGPVLAPLPGQRPSARPRPGEPADVAARRRNAVRARQRGRRWSGTEQRQRSGVFGPRRPCRLPLDRRPGPLELPGGPGRRARRRRTSTPGRARGGSEFARGRPRHLQPTRPLRRQCPQRRTGRGTERESDEHADGEWGLGGLDHRMRRRSGWRADLQPGQRESGRERVLHDRDRSRWAQRELPEVPRRREQQRPRPEPGRR